MNKHRSEIIRLANAKKGSSVWRKCISGWCLVNRVSWDDDCIYVVDDGIWVEERKAFAEGKQIEYRRIGSEVWNIVNSPKWDNEHKYRIKEDTIIDENLTEELICKVLDEDVYRVFGTTSKKIDYKIYDSDVPAGIQKTISILEFTQRMKDYVIKRESSFNIEYHKEYIELSITGWVGSNTGKTEYEVFLSHIKNYK